MHTLKIILIGFALLAACLLIGRASGGARGMCSAAIVVLPLWLIGAAVNLYIGVKTAGYSIADELPVFCIVFLVPAVAAIGLWWKIR